MSLLKTIKAGMSNTKDITFPGTTIPVRLRVLSNQDILDAAIAADRLYKGNDIPVGMQNVADYEAEKTTQQLFRACVNPETGGPIEDNITEFRKLVTGAERDVLIGEYNDLASETNPSPATMSNADFDALIVQLKKKPEATIGNVSSFRTLKRLCTFLANQLYSSPKDNGSTST